MCGLYDDFDLLIERDERHAGDRCRFHPGQAALPISSLSLSARRFRRQLFRVVETEVYRHIAGASWMMLASHHALPG